MEHRDIFNFVLFSRNISQLHAIHHTEYLFTMKGVKNMPIYLEVWGDYALFTRPEMKVERVSYDVMTPSAARGMIEAIY